MSDLSWQQARALAGSVVGSGALEQIALADAQGRTLAESVAARVDLPGFATAAMDGWVTAGPGPWQVTGTIDTGTPALGGLRSGESMRIATGGAIPDGGDAVIPWEIATLDGSVVTARLPDKVHIRPQGEECRVGDVLADGGDVVNPAMLGSLAAAAVDEVMVYRPPRFVVLVVGDEVIDSGIPITGQVRDALGVQLPGWIDAYGGRLVRTTWVADDADALSASLRAAVEQADVVIATGGTARGHRDYLRSTLEGLGADLVVDGVAVRPGHPMTLATVQGTPIVGLPGNPLSALVAMVTLVEPIVDAWHGRSDRVMPRVQMAESIAPLHKPLTRLMVGRRELGGFRQVQHVSSAMLRGISRADGWAVVPPEGAEQGQNLEWIPVPWMRRVSDDS